MPDRDDGTDIGDWMSERWADVKRLGHAAEVAGRDAWAAATRRGENVQARTPGDVRALGAKTASPRPANSPKPIMRGPHGSLSDADIAGIIFNETRSLSVTGIDQARVNIAHAVLNGDEGRGVHRPTSAPTVVSVPEVERPIYDAAVAAVKAARGQRAQGQDPTNGATHFNFRTNASRAPRDRHPLRTQTGPFKNSFPHPDLPAREGVYADTYQDD